MNGQKSTLSTDDSESAFCQVQASPRRRLLLVEDHPIVSRGLTELLNQEADLTVCGTAVDTQAAWQQLEALRPDLVVLDLSLSGCEGMDLLRQIKARRPRQMVLVLSMHDEALYAPTALREGAAGYVMKHEPTEVLLHAIRQVLNGGFYVSERLSRSFISSSIGRRSVPVLDPLRALTKRELQVFRMIGQSQSTREIARQLGISPKTVEGHRAQIKAKLNAVSVTALVRMAFSLGTDPGKRQPKIETGSS